MLAYNIQGERFRRLNLLCRQNGVEMRLVSPACFAMTIRDVLEGKTTETVSTEASFDTEMLVFCGVSSYQLNAILDGFRKGFEPVRLKAVLTEHNGNWSGNQLQQELLMEDTAVRLGQRRHQGE